MRIGELDACWSLATTEEGSESSCSARCEFAKAEIVRASAAVTPATEMDSSTKGTFSPNVLCSSSWQRAPSSQPDVMRLKIRKDGRSAVGAKHTSQ